MTTTTDRGTDAYIAAFERLESAARDRAPWLAPVRKAAIACFADVGFPTIADEEWRFTSLAPLVETAFGVAEGPPRPAPTNLLRPQVLPGDGICRLVFVNGVFSPELSAAASPAGAVVQSLAEAIERHAGLVEPRLGRLVDYEDRSPAALNTALFRDGALVHVGRGRVVERPIELVFVSTGDGRPTACFPRVLIVVDEGAQATIVERYVGLGEAPTFTSTVTELIAGDGAVVDHYRIQAEPEHAFHYSLNRVQTGRSANVRSGTFTFGGRLVRNDAHATLEGEGGDCTLNGLFVTRGQQHVDSHLRVEHVAPHCDSREYYKGILDERSSGVFTGRIYVHPGAQKTDAKQTNKNLLLSREARIDTKPQLEIFADDVKCTHGATIGQIDADAVFYLRSRGIAEAAARSLLVYAFAAESLDAIQVAPLRRQMLGLLLDRLPRGELFKELTDHGAG
ncbi:MAG TPA: Fe-S cluster assembly protein SufD [Phycisphaerae bacterium]|nr:Fe-S cluster assembly protein SufD [Phycisphaerae bacterium]